MFNTKEILEITALRQDILEPEYKTEGSCGLDVCAVDQTEIKPGEVAYIPTGLRVKVPTGFVLFIALRSSTPRKYGLIAPGGMGVIDNDYSGPTDEIKIIVQNITKETIVINHGDRLAQLLLMKIGYPELRWVPIANIKDSSRGGFGSTGS